LHIDGGGCTVAVGREVKTEIRVKRLPPLCTLTAGWKEATDEESGQYSDSVRSRVGPLGLLRAKHRPVHRLRLFSGKQEWRSDR